jgi:Pilus formation protein N terminal region
MRRLLILLPMLLVFASLSARAEDRLDVNWREARVIRLAKAATSVIVGDPTVADVTLDDPTTLVVFGKAPGETNIIVLSGSQEMLFDWPLVVSPSTERHVTVLNAASDPAPTEVLYSCGEERCARVLSPSDIAFSASSSTTTTSSTDNSKSANSSSEPNVPGSAPAQQTSPQPSAPQSN